MNISNKLTEELFGYWANLSKSDSQSIRPSGFKSAIPYTFILKKYADDDWAFHIVGSTVCYLFGREFREHNFLDLFVDNDQAAMTYALKKIFYDDAAALVDTTCSTMFDEKYSCEMLLLPVNDDNGEPTRVLGSLIPTSSTADLGSRKFVSQKINSFKVFDDNKRDIDIGIIDKLLARTYPSYLTLVHSK